MGKSNHFILKKPKILLLSSNRSRKKEIETLSGPNEFTEFYLRLKNIRQYYPKNPSEEVS
jgi:hypothetical protein